MSTEVGFPGIDSSLVFLTLRELEREYSARIGRARTGSERAALVERWAVESLRELRGVDGGEACSLRRFFYRVLWEGVRVPASRFSQETQARICRALAFGVDIATACAIEGVSRASYYEWRRRGKRGEQPYENFITATEAARATVECAVTANLTRHALKGRDWRAGAEWLRIRAGTGKRAYEIEVRAESGEPVTLTTERAEQIRRTLFAIMTGGGEATAN